MEIHENKNIESNNMKFIRISKKVLILTGETAC